MGIYEEEFKKKKKYTPKKTYVKKRKEYQPRKESYLYGKNLKEVQEGKKK